MPLFQEISRTSSELGTWQVCTDTTAFFLYPASKKGDGVMQQNR